MNKELIGLKAKFGKSAFQSIVNAGVIATPIFDMKVADLLNLYRLRQNPWEPAANFLRDEILPIMDKNNELECYMVMYLVRHLGDQSFRTGFEENSQWQHHSASSSTPKTLKPFPYSLTYIEAVVNGLLDGEDVKGTVLEEYLRFPENVVALSPSSVHSSKMFAITYELVPT